MSTIAISVVIVFDLLSRLRSVRVKKAHSLVNGKKIRVQAQQSAS
jgi:hypothetical protein